MPPLWQLPLRAIEMNCKLNESDRAKDIDPSTSIHYVAASKHPSSISHNLQEAIVLLDYLQLEILAR